MTDLHKFFLNPFDDPSLGIDDLLAFATDHQQRLTANNPGGTYAARITATATALTAVNTAFADDQTKLALRKGRKLAKDNFRKGLLTSITKIHGAVVAKYGPKGAEVTVCLPQGRGVFNRCTDDQLGTHLQVLINGVTTYQTALGAPLLADATALLTGWNAVYTVSESASGAKATSQAAKKAAREALQLELFKNLLTLVLPYALLRYFLIGSAAHYGGLDEAHFIRAVYAFSRRIEHNDTFLKHIQELLVRNSYDTPAGLVALVKEI
jgi:hypothetical protein